MHRPCWIVLLAVLVGSGCSTHRLPVTYLGYPEGSVVPDPVATVALARVTDNRDAGADWLGAIRGGYGNVVKSLRTEKPVEAVVTDVYRDALQARRLLDEPDSATYALHVDLQKLDCSYYFNREAHAHIGVSLRELSSGREVHSDTVRIDESLRGAGAGIFGNVEYLKEFAEKTLSKAVDASLDSAGFQQALAGTSAPTDSGVAPLAVEPQSPQSPAVGDPAENVKDRLKALDALLDAGTITRKEYERQRQAIIDSI